MVKRQMKKCPKSLIMIFHLTPAGMAAINNACTSQVSLSQTNYKTSNGACPPGLNLLGPRASQCWPWGLPACSPESAPKPAAGEPPAPGSLTLVTPLPGLAEIWD